MCFQWEKYPSQLCVNDTQEQIDKCVQCLIQFNLELDHYCNPFEKYPISWKTLQAQKYVHTCVCKKKWMQMDGKPGPGKQNSNFLLICLCFRNNTVSLQYNTESLESEGM